MIRVGAKKENPADSERVWWKLFSDATDFTQRASRFFQMLLKDFLSHYSVDQREEEPLQAEQRWRAAGAASSEAQSAGADEEETPCFTF